MNDIEVQTWGLVIFMFLTENSRLYEAIQSESNQAMTFGFNTPSDFLSVSALFSKLLTQSSE
jgi:hypothetical protein